MSAPGTGISQFTVTLNPNTAAGSQVVFTHDVGKLAIAIEVSDALTGQELNDAQVTTSMTLSTATVANNQTVVVTLVVLVRFLVYSPELNLLKPSDARLSFQVSPPAPSPAILSNTPPVNVDKSPALAGVAVTASRSDHKHDITTAVPAAVIDAGDAAAEGVAISIARSDHQHAVNTAVAGDLAAVDFAAAAAGVSATIPRGDHKHTLNAAIAATIADVDAGPASPGVATTIPRGDHKHSALTGIAGTINVGDAASAGVAISLARSDHVHALPAPAAPVNVTKAAASAGVATTVARADHKHDVTTAVPVDVGTANAEGVATSLARSDHVHRSTLLQTTFTEIAVDTTTTSVAFVTLLTQVITIQAGSILLIYFSTGASNSNNNNQVIFRITIDAVAQRGAAFVSASGATNTGSAAIDLRVTGLAAGARTVLVQWRVTATTGRVRPVANADTEHASLVLEEVRV